MKPLRIWKRVEELLGRGEPVALLLVAGTRGSGPGSAGSLMAVTRCETIGTVGGGSMEAELSERALEKLRTGDQTPEKAVHRHMEGDGHSRFEEESVPSGMICSGSQTTLIVPMIPSMSEEARRAVKILGSGGTGTLEITGKTLSVTEGVHADRHRLVTRKDGGWSYRGPLGAVDTVYIAGGGHVGRALARLLSGLSFLPVIIDPRERDFLKDPPDCGWITAPFREAHGHIMEGERSWVVVMTPEHRSDAEVLRSLREKELRYVGMMASRAKRDAVYSDLRSSGVPNSFLERVYCPIGIRIGSRTPEEIAVSIAAELIRVRSGAEELIPGGQVNI
ncbi:MAG: XdhC family protein [Candidatus Aegiribacteria sp.]